MKARFRINKCYNIFCFHTNLYMERKNWKYTYSAVNRDLIEYISKNSIDEIYLCGFDTDGCILKTAFDLFENNIKAYILQDYFMSSGGEKYHYEAIDILKMSYW